MANDLNKYVQIRSRIGGVVQSEPREFINIVYVYTLSAVWDEKKRTISGVLTCDQPLPSVANVDITISYTTSNANGKGNIKHTVKTNAKGEYIDTSPPIGYAYSVQASAIMQGPYQAEAETVLSDVVKYTVLYEYSLALSHGYKNGPYTTNNVYAALTSSEGDTPKPTDITFAYSNTRGYKQSETVTLSDMAATSTDSMYGEVSVTATCTVTNPLGDTVKLTGTDSYTLEPFLLIFPVKTLVQTGSDGNRSLYSDVIDISGHQTNVGDAKNGQLEVYVDYVNTSTGKSYRIDNEPLTFNRTYTDKIAYGGEFKAVMTGKVTVRNYGVLTLNIRDTVYTLNMPFDLYNSAYFNVREIRWYLEQSSSNPYTNALPTVSQIVNTATDLVSNDVVTTKEPDTTAPFDKTYDLINYPVKSEMTMLVTSPYGYDKKYTGSKTYSSNFMFTLLINYDDNDRVLRGTLSSTPEQSRYIPGAKIAITYTNTDTKESFTNTVIVDKGGDFEDGNISGGTYDVKATCTIDS